MLSNCLEDFSALNKQFTAMKRRFRKPAVREHFVWLGREFVYKRERYYARELRKQLDEEDHPTRRKDFCWYRDVAREKSKLVGELLTYADKVLAPEGFKRMETPEEKRERGLLRRRRNQQHYRDKNKQLANRELPIAESNENK